MATAAPSVETQERVTLGTRVHAELRELLISGRVSPGDKISLRTMAEELGVSMQPVRDAVARLIADEALEVLPNRAVRVPIMTLSRFRELTVVRLAIEGFAAEAAALAHEPSDLIEMRRFDDAFRKQCLSSEPDPAAAIAANRALHFAIYRAARLATLHAIIEGLWLRIGPVLNLDMRASPERLRRGRAERCHRDLVTAIERRDGRAARAALAADVNGAAAFIERRRVLVDG